MSRSPATVGVALLVLLSGIGVAASIDGPQAQPGDETTAATPDNGTPDGAVPTPSDVTQPPDNATPAPDTTTPTASARGPDSADETVTISVTASASASAAPDTARVRAAVVATAADAETARQQAAANVSTTRETLRAAGVADERIRTTGFDISTVREPEKNDTLRVRYRAVNEFTIEVSPNRTGEIIDVAVGNGTNQVNGVTFTLTEETRQSLRRQALGDAVANARADAAVIADASGVRITGLRSASTADVVFTPFETRAGDAITASAETIIEPGPVDVSATISVTYRAE
jgi:uncharacterized protein YggE